MEGGARACAESRCGNRKVRRERVPDDGVRRSKTRLGGLRRIDRRPGVQHAADRTAAIMGAMRPVWSLWPIRGPHCRGRSRPAREDRRRRCWPPSRRRSVRKSAPPAQTGLWAENSSAADASQIHPLPPNHRQSRESRSGSLHYPAAGANNWDGRCIRATFRTEFGPYSLTPWRVPPPARNQNWCNPNHFAECWNFEQSLLKLMTRRQRWSSSAGSGRPQG